MNDGTATARPIEGTGTYSFPLDSGGTMSVEVTEFDEDAGTATAHLRLSRSRHAEQWSYRFGGGGEFRLHGDSQKNWPDSRAVEARNRLWTLLADSLEG